MTHYMLSNGMLESVKANLAEMKQVARNSSINSMPGYLKDYNNSTTRTWITEISEAAITDSGAMNVNLPEPSGKQLTLALGFALYEKFYDDATSRIEATQQNMMQSWGSLVRAAPHHWFANFSIYGYIDQSIPTAMPNDVIHFAGRLNEMDVEPGADGGMWVPWRDVINPLFALKLEWAPFDASDILSEELLCSTEVQGNVLELRSRPGNRYG